MPEYKIYFFETDFNLKQKHSKLNLVQIIKLGNGKDTNSVSWVTADVAAFTNYYKLFDVSRYFCQQCFQFRNRIHRLTCSYRNHWSYLTSIGQWKQLLRVFIHQTVNFQALLSKKLKNIRKNYFQKKLFGDKTLSVSIYFRALLKKSIRNLTQPIITIHFLKKSFFAPRIFQVNGEKRNKVEFLVIGTTIWWKASVSFSEAMKQGLS